MSRYFIFAMVWALTVLSTHGAEFIWGVTGVHGSASTLFQINSQSGAVIGQIGATGASALAGLDIHPATKVLYAANGSGGPFGLFRLNKSTGAGTLIGSSGRVIPSMSFNAAGVLYGWDPNADKLVTLSLANGTATVVGGDLTPSGVGLVFGPTGLLYLKNNIDLYTLNPVTGLKATGPVALASLNPLHNLLKFNSAGTLFTGRREASTTDLYVVNPTTGALTLALRIPVLLTGFVFDTAAGPTLSVSGKRKLKITKSTVTLKGSSTGILASTVSVKGKSIKAKSAKVSGGVWKLKVKVKPGKNVLTLTCADGMGQSAAPVKVTVTYAK